MSASAKNARSMMPPPEPVSLKHKGSARMPPCPNTLRALTIYEQFRNPPPNARPSPSAPASPVD